MIELILLLTAVLSATEIVSDDKPAEAVVSQEQQVATDPSPVSDTPTDVAVEAVEAVIIPQNSSALQRIAAELIPGEPNHDLAGPVKLTDDKVNGGDSQSFTGLTLVRSDERYTSDNRQVRMEVLRPDTDAKRPAVLILHGASGIGDGTFYRGAAEIFAERGYVTFMPHYLAATQSTAPAPKKAAQKKGAKAEAKPANSIRNDFRSQEQIVQDALEAMAKNPYVDTSRIGVFGMSLGGFHALNLSSRDYRVTAVVNMSGALRGNVMPENNRLAPTLALHGAKDNLIPVSRARSLGTYLKSHGIPHEVVVYPDQGHFFRGKAQADALQRSASFFSTQFLPVASSQTVSRPTPGVR